MEYYMILCIKKLGVLINVTITKKIFFKFYFGILIITPIITFLGSSNNTITRIRVLLMRDVIFVQPQNIRNDIYTHIFFFHYIVYVRFRPSTQSVITL